MKRTIKGRYIVLAISILIPLLVAFFVGSYGYNSTNYGQGSWKKQFLQEYLSTEDKSNPTTEHFINRYLKYGINNQYFVYNADPIYDLEIKDNNGNKLFDLLVYQAIYKFSENNQPVDRMQYIFFYYNIQYKNIRNLFDVDDVLREEINKANVPTFSANVKEVIGEEIEDYDPYERPITQIPEDQLSIRDRGADVTFKSGKVATDGEEIPNGEVLVKAFIGFVPIREITKSSKFEVKIEAVINSIIDDTGSSLRTTVTTLELDLPQDPTKVDSSNFAISYQQNLEKAGYFWWAFTHKIWWICLIALAATSLITITFYLVYVAEEKMQLEEAAKRAKKRKR